jgi:hypothetical protein
MCTRLIPHRLTEELMQRRLASWRRQSQFYSLRSFSLKRFQDVGTTVNRHKATVCFLGFSFVFHSSLGKSLPDLELRRVKQMGGTTSVSRTDSLQEHRRLQ